MLHPTLRVRPGRIVGFAISLLIPTFLFALFLSLAPQVHQRIHSDANDASHECAVTLFASAGCLRASGDSTKLPVMPLIPTHAPIAAESSMCGAPATISLL